MNCTLCGSTGWVRISKGSDLTGQVARCECRRAQHVRLLSGLANIPARHDAARFANYRLDGPQQRFAGAHLWARAYAEKYPDVEERGVLFIGTFGAGKTHLAVSILHELLAKGIAGRFYDYCELMREMQSSYHPDSELSAMELLAPAIEVEVLVLDDLGTVKPSDWVMDTIALLLNARYRNRRPTIITTNYPERAPDGELTLKDRVGERVVSRLREMCRIVNMAGPDYRLTMHRPVGLGGGIAMEGRA